MAKEKFEDAMQGLEIIVRKMESGDMSLEESLKAFEDGVRLARSCAQRLDEAQRRVEVLLGKGDAAKIEPFTDSTE